MSVNVFHYGEDILSAGIALNICRKKTKGILSTSARENIRLNRHAVESIVKGHKTVYGINTGFGPLCTTLINEEDTKRLQYNLLLSHSVGVGEPVDQEISKLMLILKVHSLAKAYSGVSTELLERIIWHIDHDVIPIVPSQGSVGASGDLAPLAHLFLPLVGLGRVVYRGEELPALDVLRMYQLQPLEPGPKEGLALINGTQFMLAHGIVLLEKLQNCLDHADIIAAMNLEALMGSAKSFDEELHLLRPYPGSQYVAQRFRTLLDRSEIIHSHENCARVQDPYSLRCIPQVHGASRDAWLHLKDRLQIEMNSVTDNPVVFHELKTITGGNFHGQPLALPFDYAAVAAAELGNISDRRIYLSLCEVIPDLPRLLMKHTGLNSGFMILQYTSAALVSENKSLCFPASADSIPTSLGQEDHVSMGSIGVRKALRIVENLEKILGIELFTAAQGFEFRKPLHSGYLIDKWHEWIRQEIEFAENDRLFSPDLEKAIELIRSKKLIKRMHKERILHQIDFKNDDHERFGIY
ncbi:MAG TPA: histidine ammonia-lyase [Prolixibacteraceae bacterium]|nr:histidine ammonia-lyase [Prolixibacteraceae bacterium]